MTRNTKNRRNNKKMAAAATKKKSSAAVVYGDKKVYVSSLNRGKPVSWMKINPHYSGDLDKSDADEIDGCFALTRMPGTMNTPPPDRDAYKLLQLNTPVFNSEIYFVGGRHLDRDGFVSSVFCPNSIKVFTYHLLSFEWKELPCRLNIGRGLAHVAIAGGVAYIFGGSIIDYRLDIPNKEHWIECFNLLDQDENNNKKKNWEYLPATSAPPDVVFKDYFPMYTFVYELRNVIVFVMEEAGCYAFNYVKKTWAPFLVNINDHVRVRGISKVVVIDHLLFWHYDNYIRAYDLKNDRLVLSVHLIQLNISMDVLDWGESYLERVGNDTLLLICRNHADWPVKKLDFFKLQIQNMAEASYDNLLLTQIGRGSFLYHGYVTLDVVAA